MWTLQALPPHLHSATQPTPTLAANHVTASRPSGSSLAGCTTSLRRRIVLLWRANCLPPPFSFYRRGWVPLLDMGASCSDPASGVTSPTVWEASHVTHHCIATPSAQPRALSHTAALSANVLTIVVWLYSTQCFCLWGRQKYGKPNSSNGRSPGEIVWITNFGLLFNSIDICILVFAVLAQVCSIGAFLK